MFDHLTSVQTVVILDGLDILSMLDHLTFVQTMVILDRSYYTKHV